METRGKSFYSRLIMLAAFFLAARPFVVQADMASPHIIYEKQPDGTEIALRIKGSDVVHWQEDLDGYTVVRTRGNSGRYVYAKQGANGHLAPTSHEVGKADPKVLGLKRRELPSETVRKKMRDEGPAGQSPEDAAVGQPAFQAVELGPQTLKNLVVLVRFSDHTGRTLPSQANIDVLMNAVGGDPTLAPAGSLRDIYLNNSYGALTIDSTVVAWATVSQPEEYYAAGNSGLTSTIHQALAEALNIVDGVIDFREFDQDSNGYIDAITFLHSGYGAEWGGTDANGTYYTDRIWSHKWALYSLPGGSWQSTEGVRVYNYHISPSLWGTSGNTIGRIGVIAHETGHFLGLPDLYDTDSTGEGVGSWCLMANSWGGDGSQQPPPLMSAWSKMQMGWLSPTDLTAAGHYILGDSLNSSSVYKVTSNYPANEYLLIENRRRKNASNVIVDNIPASGDGLVIYHIDGNAGYNTEGYPGQTGWPTNGNHYRVAVLQADGNYNLEKNNNRGDSTDAYKATGVSAIGAATVPSTDSYQGGVVYPTNNEISGISAAGAVMEFDFGSQAPVNFTLSVSKSGNGTVSSTPSGISCGATCSADFTSSTSVTLSAAPDTGWTFSGWSGACSGSGSCVLTMTGNTSVTATFAPIPLPNAPSNLTATAVKGRRINLAWADNSSNETGFKIERSLNQSSWTQIATTGANIRTYANSSLTIGTTYYYRVRAYNGSGNSAYSNTASAKAIR
ncbi:M6 family metalloprotease domain-containing protein [Candidatus Electronema sp. PJ]|uniref:M6 family metalloprotease domain-containing protein n=1 Tax=Candidatus Electronema sp. PJ TaxID=3401572 RepID=UPI003AA9B42E